jgi:hypothetical protein
MSFDYDNVASSCAALYLLEIPYAHDLFELRGSNGLGRQMELLKLAETEFDEADLLFVDTIARLVGVPIARLRKDYEEYLRLLVVRRQRIARSQQEAAGSSWLGMIGWSKGLEVPPLPGDHFNLWGSIRQLKFGKVVVDTLHKSGLTTRHLHPVFGALLSPTGGMVGPGDTDLTVLAPGERSHRTYWTMHAIVHDAAGYLHNYHGVGPGYNYLNALTLIVWDPKGHPFAGQYAGLRYWQALIRKVKLGVEDPD